MMGVKVLVVDDEASIRETVSFYLEREGFVALTARDGHEALLVYESEKPDLMILDVMIPGVNGFDVCSHIRERDEDVPVIFLSAKNDIVDKGVGFKSGADDYVTKPYSPDELMMRVNSCLRRRIGRPQAERNDGAIVLGDLEVRPLQREARLDGEIVPMSTKEFELLAYMAAYPNIVFTRTQLLQGVWGEDYVGDQGVVAVYVRRLREKIERDPGNPRHLLTDWGVGYRLVP